MEIIPNNKYLLYYLLSLLFLILQMRNSLMTFSHHSQIIFHNFLPLQSTTTDEKDENRRAYVVPRNSLCFYFVFTTNLLCK